MKRWKPAPHPFLVILFQPTLLYLYFCLANPPPRDHQLSLTRGLFAGELLTSSASACAEVAEGDDEEMDLIYDPNLGLYFDPKSNSFFMRE